MAETLTKDEVAERLSKAFDGDFEAIPTDAVITCPEEWTPMMIHHFKTWWDAIVPERSHVHFVPHGLASINDSKAIVVLGYLVDAVAALADDAPDRWKANRAVKSARDRLLRLLKEPESET